MNSYKDNDKEQPDDDQFDPMESNTLYIIYGILILVMTYVSTEEITDTFFGFLLSSFMGVLTFCAASMPYAFMSAIFSRHRDKFKWLGWVGYVGGVYLYYLMSFKD